MTKQENPNFKASRFAPNPQEVAYWIDLTADPNGGVIKTYDGSKWNVISGNDTDIDIPVATADSNGLMSSQMVKKLNGIQTNANYYTLPAATLNAIGGVKKAGKVDNLATDAELSAVISKINTLLSNLRSIGILTL